MVDTPDEVEDHLPAACAASGASLFLPEDTPRSIALLTDKAAADLSVQIMLGDPDPPEMARRGVEEQLYDAIPARTRMALAYYSPLVDVSGVDFRLHRKSLYNSIFRLFDSETRLVWIVAGDRTASAAGQAAVSRTPDSVSRTPDS